MIDQHPDLAGALRAFFADYDRVHRVARPLQEVAQAARGEIATEPVAASRPGRTTAGSQATLAPEQADHDLTSDFSADPTPHDEDGNGDLPRGARVRYFGDYELLARARPRRHGRRLPRPGRSASTGPWR